MEAEIAFGRKLREMRRATGWSQEQLAAHMSGFGWIQSTVSKTEAGARLVRLDEITALAALFGMSLSGLLDDGDGLSAAQRRREMERVIRKQIAAEILDHPG